MTAAPVPPDSPGSSTSRAGMPQTGANPVPELPGILTAAQVRATAASIAAMQEPCGAIPWTPGEHTDVWNHVEAAMALLVGGQRRAAERALHWVPTHQRADGSCPMRIVADVVEDHSGDTNMSAYLAVGLWHHWLSCRDAAFVAALWPAVRAGLDWVVSMQLPWGGIAWGQEWSCEGVPGPRHPDALLAGSSSIHQSLRAGLALADLLGQPQPDWELAVGRLAHALVAHRDRFLDKSTFSMDWYYPVLGGAVRGGAASELLAARWTDFVVPGLGIRCVDTNPWVTGAETCELAMALDAIGDRDRALTLVADTQHLRTRDGAYWTGYVWPDDVFWPVEHTTYTAAAVVLAVDALSDSTSAAGIMRGVTLPVVRPMAGDACGCSRALV